MLLNCCNSSIFSRTGLEQGSLGLLCSLLLAISSKKCWRRLDSYFSLSRFSSRVLTSPGNGYFLRWSLDPCLFFTVFFTDLASLLFSFQGLEKGSAFWQLFLVWGRLCWMEYTIWLISFSRGFEIGAISERLKAPIILRISERLAWELFFLYYLVYSYKQLAITRKSSIFQRILSEKSACDCLRLVTVELPFLSSPFLVRLITLMVCLLFFLGWNTRFPLLNLLTEWFECVSRIEAAWDFGGSALSREGSLPSVLRRGMGWLLSFLTQSDPFFLCLHSCCWLVDCWWEKELLLGRASVSLIRWYAIDIVLKIISLNTLTSKMLAHSKKNTVSHKKLNPPNCKPGKRSKSTEHLLPSKTPKKRVLREESEDTFVNSHSLAKSKSAKSVKSKASTQARSVAPCKKGSSKKKSQAKTGKKVVSRESNEVSSILTEQWKPAKPTNQFFIYCNNYIPIENSAQRRLVYKIQMIDLENKSTSDSFQPSHPRPPELPLRLQDQQVGTDPAPPTLEVAIGQTVDNSQQETQTSDRNSYEEVAEKCFSDVLTELEFLYMPNENNFHPFNQDERLHYGQMLEALAKKMLVGCKNLVTGNQMTEDQVTVLMYQREGIQVGALEFVPAEGFPTHLLAVLAYLKNLFCFIDYSFREEVIANLRQFYGYNYNERVSRLTKRLPHERDRKSVLSPEIFKTFEHEMFKDYEFPSEVVRESVHIHNRAVFDAVNAELQAFRPFFTSEGEPFPWSINLGMTHYDITEEALYIIFMQVKDKLQKQLVTLCGMHLDFDDKSLPSPASCKLYQKKMEERAEKMVVQDLKTVDDSVDLDYQRTGLRFQLADEVFYQLIQEIERQMCEMEQTDPFQYFL